MLPFTSQAQKSTTANRARRARRKADNKMSHFYGKLQGARGEATRCGNKHTGLEATAAAWGGCVETTLWHDEAAGVDMAEVRLARWQGRGSSRILYRGPVNPDEDQATLDAAQMMHDLNPRDEGEAADAADRARTARTGGGSPNPEIIERKVCRAQAAHEHAEIWKQDRAKNRAIELCLECSRPTDEQHAPYCRVCASRAIC